MNLLLFNTMSAAPLNGIERCYTIEEVAAHLNISVTNMRKLVHSGRIPAIKIGRQYRIYESDLSLFLKQNRGKHIPV